MSSDDFIQRATENTQSNKPDDWNSNWTVDPLTYEWIPAAASTESSKGGGGKLDPDLDGKEYHAGGALDEALTWETGPGWSRGVYTSPPSGTAVWDRENEKWTEPVEDLLPGDETAIKETGPGWSSEGN